MEVHIIDMSDSGPPAESQIISSSNLQSPRPAKNTMLLRIPSSNNMNPDQNHSLLSPDRSLVNSRRSSAVSQGFFYKNMMNKIINSPLQMVRKQEKLLERYNTVKDEFDDLLNKRGLEGDFDRHQYSELLNSLQRTTGSQRQELTKLNIALDRMRSKDYYMPHDDNVYFNEVRHLFLAEKNPDSKELSFAAAVEKLAKKFQKMSKKVEMEEFTNGTLRFIK